MTISSKLNALAQMDLGVSTLSWLLIALSSAAVATFAAWRHRSAPKAQSPNPLEVGATGERVWATAAADGVFALNSKESSQVANCFCPAEFSSLEVSGFVTSQIGLRARLLRAFCKPHWQCTSDAQFLCLSLSMHGDSWHTFSVVVLAPDSFVADL